MLTIQQVAEGLQVCDRVAKGLGLPAVQVGQRTVRYLWGSVLDWLKDREEPL